MRQIPEHCFSSNWLSCVYSITAEIFSCVNCVFFSSMSDSRDWAKKVRAPHLPSGPVGGDESRAVHQTGHRLSLHLSCLHGNTAFHYVPHIGCRSCFALIEVLVIGNRLHLSFTATGGKLCPFHHIRPRPSERLSEYSLGNHGECFYFPLRCSLRACKSIISMRFGGHLYNLRLILRGLSWREERHGTGAERADFQGERRCCLGLWEPVSQSHTRSALAADRGRDRHTVELLLPWRSFTATMGTATIACTLLSILLLSALVPFPLISGNIFGHHVSYFGELGVESEKGIISPCICTQLLLVSFLRLLMFRWQASSCVVIWPRGQRWFAPCRVNSRPHITYCALIPLSSCCSLHFIFSGSHIFHNV